METSRLRQFKAVVDTGGLLRASEVLNLSPGGLSKSLKTLESEIGFALFDRKGRALELTPEGRAFYERLPGVLTALDDLVHPRGKTASAETPLRIVSFEVFTTSFLGEAAGKLPPNLALEIREAIPGHMENMVADGHSDIGITYLPIPRAGVEFLKVGRIGMGVFGLKKNWKGVPARELPFVVPVAPMAGTPSGVQGLDGWPEHLFARRAPYRVEMMETAIQLCRRGLGVSFLPRFIVDRANAQAREEFHLSELSASHEVPPVHRDVFLIQRQGDGESKTVRLLAKAIRALD